MAVDSIAPLETSRPRPIPVAAEPGMHHEVLTGLDRSARMPQFYMASPGANDALRALHVVAVGASSVGLLAIETLGRMGVRRLTIVDRGKTKLESMLTHDIRVEELGLAKASLAARRVKAMHPESEVRAFDGPFEQLGPEALLGASLVLLASDNLACEVEVAQRCVQLGIPLVQASVYGPLLTAQVRWAPNAPGGGCLICAYGADEMEALDRNTIYSCEESAAPGSAPEPSAVPTVSPPHLCAIAAQLAVGEIMRMTLELGPHALASDGDDDDGWVIDYCGYGPTLTRSRLARREDCICDHTRWSVVKVERPLGELTPREAIACAGHDASDAGAAALSLTVDGHVFLELAGCRCGRHPKVGRFEVESAAPRPCAGCGEALMRHPLHTHRDVPLLALTQQLDAPLGDLGVREAACLRVSSGAGSSLIVEGASL
jgi:molybdopterin/thiamine biosynthesis adenylyltransferase